MLNASKVRTSGTVPIKLSAVTSHLPVKPMSGSPPVTAASTSIPTSNLTSRPLITTLVPPVLDGVPPWGGVLPKARAARSAPIAIVRIRRPSLNASLSRPTEGDSIVTGPMLNDRPLVCTSGMLATVKTDAYCTRSGSAAVPALAALLMVRSVSVTPSTAPNRTVVVGRPVRS